MYDQAAARSMKLKLLPNMVDEVMEITLCIYTQIAETEKPISCLELLKKGNTRSGIYQIYVASMGRNVEVGMLCTTLLSSADCLQNAFYGTGRIRRR